MSLLATLLLALVLVASGASHLRAPAATAAQLRSHGVVGVVPTAVVGLGLAEVGLTMWLAVGLFDVTSPVPPLVLAGTFLLGCAGYLALVRAKGGAGLPCGCGLGVGGVGGWSIARALALGAVGLVAAASTLDGTVQSPSGVAEWAIAVLAALTFALLAAILPTARPAREVSQ